MPIQLKFFEKWSNVVAKGCSVGAGRVKVILVIFFSKINSIERKQLIFDDLILEKSFRITLNTSPLSSTQNLQKLLLTPEKNLLHNFQSTI